MNAKACQDMKGMDMQNMDAKSCQDMMKSMNTQQAN